MLGPDAFDAAWVLATCGWHFVRWKAAGGTQYHARVALLIGQVMTAMECASMAVEEEAATKLGRAVIDLVDALAQPGRFECLGRSIGARACRVLARAAREVAFGSTSCEQLVRCGYEPEGAWGPWPLGRRRRELQKLGTPLLRREHVRALHAPNKAHKIRVSWGMHTCSGGCSAAVGFSPMNTCCMRAWGR